MSDDQISFTFILWFSLKWFVANMGAWILSGLIMSRYAEESGIIYFVFLLGFLLLLIQWLVLRPYGDWALSWVLAELATLIILSATIGGAIILALMCFPATCLIVVLVTAGFGWAILNISEYLPEFPAWIPPPVVNALMILILAAPIFISTYEDYGFLISVITGGLFGSYITSFGFFILWLLRRKDQVIP
jgi:hypothetical protein